jgi:inorganic phosphate transporter, PiT family
MTVEAVLLILAFCFCFYVAWNIGANDVANAVGTSVGSGAITLKQAVILAAIFEFCGAFFFGAQVSETLEGGIVNPTLFSDNQLDYVYGMLASLLSAGIWLQIASFFGWPVSTTHTIVGAVIGFGLIYGGFGAIYWGELGSILASWFISPLLGGSLAYLIFSIMRKRIFYHPRPIQAALKITPYILLVFFFIITLVVLFQGLDNLDLHLNIFQAVAIATIVALFAASLSYFLIHRYAKHEDQPSKELQQLQAFMALKKAEHNLTRVEAYGTVELSDEVRPLLDKIRTLSEEIKGEEKDSPPSEYRKVEKIFVYLQLITACAMAFAHGSNDVANAIGPLAAIANILMGQNGTDVHYVPIYLLLLGGVGIVIGLATWGWRVIETIGTKITDLTPSRGFAAGFGAAITVVLASKLGLPISTTHVIVGAVLGVGFARGIGAINLYTCRDILISWIVTVPAGAILSVLFFYCFKAIFS